MAPVPGFLLKDVPDSQMLKCKRSMDRQYAGKLIRHYFNGFGYQLRLAEAIRKLMEQTLPKLKKTKKIKANKKTGEPARLIIDPRLKKALKALRQVGNACRELDRALNPDLGPLPVTRIDKIPPVNI